jgi:hypothetical protein
MRLIGRDVDCVELPDRVARIADTRPAASAHPDNDVAMAMAFETCVTAGFQFEIPHVKSNSLAMFSGEHLARCAAELTASMRADLVRLDLYAVPSETRPESMNDLRIAFGASHI